ncbi:MAG: N-acetyltransferase family protein [Parvibaculaceae bacterium]
MIVRRLPAEELDGAAGALAEILIDAVHAGAGVSFMAPLARTEAEAYWRGLHDALASGRTILFVAEAEGRIEGTVQLCRPWAPNQPHRADLAKMLVHPRAWKRGIGRGLLSALEAEARRLGITLITFDTAVGSPAERFYQHLGFTRVGVIPDYAYLPHGELAGTALFYRKLTP